MTDNSEEVGKAVTSATTGATAGATLAPIVGPAGLAIAGTAVAVPVLAVLSVGGAILGLAVFAVYRLFRPRS